jgi:urease accessory protein
VGALRAAAREDLQACRDIDATLEAMKPVKEFRDGSRQMGRQTLRVAAALTGEARLARYSADVDKGLASGHHAVAYGLAAAALGWEPEWAATAYLYSTTALLVGAALRLLSMGQMEGQRVLWGLHPVIERVAREAAERDAGDLWSFAPGIELAGIRHASLEMRLFRS